MKATELRIGSIIRFTPDKSEFTIDESIQELDDGLYEGFYIDSINICNFEPIPLTEEWLERFGFTQGMGGEWCAKDVAWTVWFDGERLSVGFWQGNEPKYVHSLQNLYFALTGLELSIKE